MLSTVSHLALDDLKWGEEIVLPSTRSLRKSPHLIGGRYPCRSAAYIPRMIFKEYSLLNNTDEFNVLDPFMGSGTTAIEASHFTKNIYGLEIDPYARLIATVSNLRYTQKDVERINSTSQAIIDTWETLLIDDSLKPSLKNIDYWFHKRQFKDLLKLKTNIKNFSEGSKKVQDFLMVAFADIIRGCSKAERQSLKPYVSTRFVKQPQDVLTAFQRTVEKYIGALAATETQKSKGVKWLKGNDATNFKSKTQFDIVVTSPPYINAIDYTRCIKLESSWVGLMDDSSLIDIRNGQVGESARTKSTTVESDIENLVASYLEPIRDLDERRFHTAQTYFQDISANLDCVYRCLKQYGEYHLIIGNSTIRGAPVPTHQVIADIAKYNGFNWDGYFKYPIRDHRTSIPRNGKGGKIAFEHVIKLTKP